MVTYSVLRPGIEGEEAVVDFRHKRMKPLSVNVVLAQLDISGLVSGNYSLKVEVKDKSQNVLSSQMISFSRSNPLADLEAISTDEDIDTYWLDTLSDEKVRYCLRATPPILSGDEVETLNYLLAKSEDKYKRNFLHHVWSSRYGTNAGLAFSKYMEVADALNIMFRSGFGYGFETDRGRMYLKYGRPDQRIEVEDDQGAFPYEIWYYTKMDETGQSDVRFLFYNPSLATNDYLLLTTTCRGERSNPRWERDLYRNSGGSLSDNSVDATRVQEGYRRRARELYED
jgi:GWxTD domain-containing protein